MSALNRLEVVETGRRRRWSEEEKARIVLERMSEPRLLAATARRYGLSRSLLVTWQRALAANRTQSEAGLVRVVVAEGGVASRRIHHGVRQHVRPSVGLRSSWPAGGASLSMRASTLRRFAGSSRLWIRDDSDPYGSSGVAGDRSHRHAQRRRLFVVPCARGDASRSAGRSFVLLPRTPRRSFEGNLA